MKPIAFLFLMASTILFGGCMIDDGDPKHYLDVSSKAPSYEYFGEKGEALKTWEQNNETFYYAQYYDQSMLFLFDCIATAETPRLISGFALTNLQAGNLSAVTSQGVRSNSYILYRDNPEEETTNPMGIYLKKEGKPSEAEFYKVHGVYVTNCRGAYHAMEKGNKEINKFGKDDWFKLTIYNKDKTKKVEVMLGNGNNLITKWEYIKLTSLGATDRLLFELSSSVGDATKIPSLSYFCLDAIVLE